MESHAKNNPDSSLIFTQSAMQQLPSPWCFRSKMIWPTSGLSAEQRTCAVLCNVRPFWWAQIWKPQHVGSISKAAERYMSFLLCPWSCIRTWIPLLALGQQTWSMGSPCCINRWKVTIWVRPQPRGVKGTLFLSCSKVCWCSRSGHAYCTLFHLHASDVGNFVQALCFLGAVSLGVYLKQVQNWGKTLFLQLWRVISSITEDATLLYCLSELFNTAIKELLRCF